jgi:signal transduction histidine kinase
VRTEAGSCPPYSPQIRAVAAAVPSRWGRPRREQIAQDLRDNTIQRIFAVSLGMTALAGRLDDPQVQRRLEEYVDDLDIAISAIYAAVSELTSNESDDEISEMS